MIKEMIDKHKCVIFYIKTKYDIITFVKDASSEMIFSKRGFVESYDNIIGNYFHSDGGDLLVQIIKIDEEYNIYRRYRVECYDYCDYMEWINKYKTFNYSSYLRKEKLLKLI